jgi:ornithine cyclodeaminase/alanine dehydrogenase-like protein (mu-crystallin family)
MARILTGDDKEMTIYQSCGLAVQDVVTAKVVYDKALDQDVGVEVPF